MEIRRLSKTKQKQKNKTQLELDFSKKSFDKEMPRVKIFNEDFIKE